MEAGRDSIVFCSRHLRVSSQTQRAKVTSCNLFLPLIIACPARVLDGCQCGPQSHQQLAVLFKVASQGTLAQRHPLVSTYLARLVDDAVARCPVASADEEDVLLVLLRTMFEVVMIRKLRPRPVSTSDRAQHALAPLAPEEEVVCPELQRRLLSQLPRRGLLVRLAFFNVSCGLISGGLLVEDMPTRTTRPSTRAECE
jgi:hypothetical protein